MQATCEDKSNTQITGFGAAHLRALESSRADRIVNDPFAKHLTQQSHEDLKKLLSESNKSWGDLIAIRSRYLDEALDHRDSNIRQVVILGAGLDTRGFRLESLRGCHILAIDQSCLAFDRLNEVMKREQASPIAKKIDYIVADLAEDDWDHKVLARGFDPCITTFWIMEGLLPYMERSRILKLLDTIDGMSAPGSELWADIAGQATFNFASVAVTMKFYEEDPLHGVLTSIPWCLKLQASLENEGLHFGRKWTPLTSLNTDKSVPIAFVIGKKPIPTKACEKDVCPGNKLVNYRQEMNFASSSPLFQTDASEVDDAFAESMGFVTTYLRGVESTRNDRIIHDPFAEPLTRNQQPKIEQFVKEELSEVYAFPENAIALRTRYLDEALHHRNPRILQVVILGAGLDSRAYRLESLRGCHVLEVDQSAAVFEHKTEVMKELHAPLIAQKVDCIVSNLVEAGLEVTLMGYGYSPTMPTFWVMEGLLPYMERSSIVELLKSIEYLSAPGSEIWADLPGHILVDSEEWGKRAMKYGEDDPLHGVFSEIPWTLEIQTSLKSAGDHFGRHWTPILSPKTKQVVPFSFVVGKKPIPAAVVEQEMCPGLAIKV
ncbi:O-methyltransferase [Phytophthora palmivora]|uniref:O-methyltransferase n=1 Tax=Phytophthora palmivora TaxID=4796 RepID=A0A2P4YE56_9STRA|nr:O-methyltransferase [Phytophthora palmivora]